VRATGSVFICVGFDGEVEAVAEDVAPIGEGREGNGSVRSEDAMLNVRRRNRSASERSRSIEPLQATIVKPQMLVWTSARQHESRSTC
jgi:hypothetical protein